MHLRYAVLGLVALVGVAACGSSAHHPGVTPGAPLHGAAVYRVVGNKILQSDQQQFIPYGFVIYCLAETSPRCATTPTPADAVPDTTKIRAAATYWHANVVRLQVAEQNLPSVLNQLRDEVQRAHSLGMVAIITDQEEDYGGPPLPTAGAIPFWDTIAANFKDDPRAFFDLYNEPRISLPKAGRNHGNAADWQVWRNGGDGPGKTGTPEHYVGMQALVDHIRAAGANNIVIAEGLKADKDLSGIPQYALTGSNIAYGMEPDLKPNDVTPEQWAANWGNLSGSVPIMMEAFQDWPGAGSCNVDSPTLLPKLLAYLKSKRLGLIAWALDPGVLIVDNDPQHPTSYQGTNSQVCFQGTANATKAATATFLQSNSNGPGELILAFFRANGRPAPA